MAGYNDTRNLIIEALMGRQAGTEIQPEKHQAYALNMVDYIRSVELVSTSTLAGLAEESTVPVQPNNGKVCYIAGVGQDRTVTFTNFIDNEGNPISITTGDMEGVFVILLWNTEYWTAYAFDTNIISNAENADFYYSYNIRKTYASVAAMNADSENPVGTDGRLIKIGELVTVVNPDTPSENAFYSRIEGDWLLQSGFNFEVVQTTGTDINRPMSQDAVTKELLLKVNTTDIEQVRSQATNKVPASKLFDDELTQVRSDLSENELLRKIEGVKISSGANLLNRNYIEPSNPLEYEKGGKDRLINNTTGIIFTYTGWYVSPLIEWKDNLKITASQYRAWAQYKSDGITPTSINFPEPMPSGSVTIDRDVDAKYIRLVVFTDWGNIMTNYGDVVLPYEPHEEFVNTREYGSTPLFFYGSLKEMLLSESYIPQSPTYTDGIINSPINVIWVDGDTGVLTLTRNADGLVTKIVATKIRSGVTTTLTENITRDSDGNVTLISIV